jgi:PAS domain S-box-containing protein
LPGKTLSQYGSSWIATPFLLVGGTLVWKISLPNKLEIPLRVQLGQTRPVKDHANPFLLRRLRVRGMLDRRGDGFPFLGAINFQRIAKDFMDEKTLQAILDAFPYPIVYVDRDHVIRFLNKNACYHYYQERGYHDLIGKSLFDCHPDHSREKILEVVEKLKNHAQEMFLTVNVRNQRLYITPVRDEAGELIGYFERFELNQQV